MISYWVGPRRGGAERKAIVTVEIALADLDVDPAPDQAARVAGLLRLLLDRPTIHQVLARGYLKKEDARPWLRFCHEDGEEVGVQTEPGTLETMAEEELVAILDRYRRQQPHDG